MPDVLTLLRSKIEAGAYAPDGKLGTYKSLMAEWSVASQTLAKAFEVLKSENVLIVNGGGIYIADRPGIRWCPFGEHYVSLDDFASTVKSAKNPEGRQPYCIPCARLNSQLRWHNMSLSEYKEMLAAQGGKCASCEETFITTPHIDHDHTCCPGGKSCGKCTRSLLCRPCNATIGMSQDNLDRLIAAAVYLQRFKEVGKSAVASQ